MPETIDRNSGLGASDAAPAAGESRYRSRLQLWLEKTGQLPGVEENERMRWGTLLQPVVLAEFCHRTGLVPIHGEQRIQHPEIPWMWATVDTRISADELVEAKTCGHWAADEFGEAGTDEVPTEYILQCQHQMAVTGASLVYVPVLIAGQELRIFHVKRNDALIASLVQLESEFWRHVQERIPPETLPSDRAFFDVLYAPQDGEIIDLGDDAMELVREYERAGEEVKAWSERKDQAKAQIKALMGTASIGVLPDGREARRTLVEVKGYTVGPRTDHRFSIKAPKKARATR